MMQQEVETAKNAPFKAFSLGKGQPKGGPPPETSAKSQGFGKAPPKAMEDPMAEWADWQPKGEVAFAKGKGMAVPPNAQNGEEVGFAKGMGGFPPKMAPPVDAKGMGGFPPKGPPVDAKSMGSFPPKMAP